MDKTEMNNLFLVSTSHCPMDVAKATKAKSVRIVRIFGTHPPIKIMMQSIQIFDDVQCDETN